MYVFIFILTDGILPWRHVAIDDRHLPSIRFGVMASCEFSEKVLSCVRAECHSMLSRLRDLFFSPAGYSTSVTPDMFIAQLHL